MHDKLMLNPDGMLFGIVVPPGGSTLAGRVKSHGEGTRNIKHMSSNKTLNSFIDYQILLKEFGNLDPVEIMH